MSTAEIFDFERISQAGRISDEDVAALRKAFFEDGDIDASEAGAIFRLGETCKGESDAWPLFLVEALTDYIVFQTEPRGYVSNEQAEWLIEHIRRDGDFASPTELELLLKILEASTETPRALAAFALDQAKHAVLNGSGSIVGGEEFRPGVIGKAEVDILRRLLYAVGGSGNIAITREEAELLFDLNDATIEAENHSAWSDLFTKAILNHLMAGNHYVAPSRERALRISKWLDAPNAGVGGFFGKLFTNEMLSVKGFYEAMGDSDWRQTRLEKMEEAAHAAEAITRGEAQWLAARIGRDGNLHENEKAILRFIRDECPELHPGLEALMGRL
ncbi:MAG: hypothetical protein RLZ98_2496 [Pseudomonadota bacterium]|jgi:hypothetical protein